MQRDPEKKEAGLIRRCLSPCAGQSLEIGCGNGRLTADLAKYAVNLIAADSYLEDLVSARRCIGTAVKFVAAFGEWLPFAANSYDTVIFTLSLHHQKPQMALKEASRVLKDDGQILVLEPVADSPVSELFAIIDDESEKYALAEIAIDSSGLKVIGSGAVRTRWVFEDAAEVVSHLFDYFGLEPDNEKESIMLQLLGDLQGMKPLPIEDVTRYWLLRM
jgi:SAM-dependent methyltransferase